MRGHNNGAKMGVVAIVVLMFSTTCVAQSQIGEPQSKESAIDSYAFESDTQRQLFLELTAVLRCPMCQNQNIADSDAMIAHDMRRKVYQLLQQGQSKQDIIAFMRTRYGDFVYYQPPVTPLTMWLWLLPIVFAISALIFIARKSKPMETDKIESKLAKAEAILEREK